MVIELRTVILGGKAIRTTSTDTGIQFKHFTIPPAPQKFLPLKLKKKVVILHPSDASPAVRNRRRCF